MNAAGRDKQRGFWRLSLIILLLVLIGLPIGLLALVSDSQPLVTDTARVDSSSAIKARQLAKQFYRGLMRPASAPSSRISLSENDLNEMLALAVRGIPSAKSRARIESGNLLGELTLRLPANPLGEYVNVVAHIKPFANGLKISELQVGDLTLSGRWLLALVELVLNRALEGETLGTELLAAIESLSIDQANMTLVYHPVANFQHKVKQLKAQVQLGENDSQKVRDYYLRLCEFRQQGPAKGYPSLSTYLSHIFEYAGQRSLASKQSATENRAALLALTLFLGSERFDTVLGALDGDTRRGCRPARDFIGLAQRDDLRLHFIFSAALQVITSSGVSFSIGEFKELLDTEQGRSGFSFADLAADRAGIRFAEFALHKEGAGQLQSDAAKLAQENIFFPSISGLPEGIRQQDFEGHGGIESEFYRKYLRVIERRIEQLPLYQLP